MICHIFQLFFYSETQQYQQYILHQYMSISFKLVHIILGIIPLYMHRCVQIVKYWFKILNSSPKRIIRKVYNILLQDSINGKINWVSKLKDFLYSIGLGYVWMNQDPTQEKYVLLYCKQIMSDNFKQTMFSSLSHSSRGKTYLTINPT